MFRTSIGFVALILLFETSFGNCVSFENSPLLQEFDAESNIVIARSSEDGTSNVERINENEADREDEIPNSDLFESKTEEYLVTLPSITGETPTIDLNVTYDATEYNGTSNDTSDVQGTTISGNAVSSTMEQTNTDFSITETTSPCEPNPCLNSGNCTEVLMIDYNCSCEADYIGQHCETRDYCTTNGESGLCKNGACVYGPNKRYRFCKCFSGDYWDTVTQECKNEERPCWPNPCKFGGNCTIVSPDNYKCICKESYSGQRCEIQDMCETNREGIKCENGECKFDKKNNLKYCKCNENFYLDGKTKSCKRNKPPCEPNPCKYGHCNILSEGSFNCTCDDYYIGNRCDILNYCFPDKEGNICKNGFCKLSGTTQYCVCSVGYYMDDETDACKPVSPPCAPNPCMNDGICTPISQKDFNCSCADGYIGSRCHIRSWCKLDGGKEFCAPSSCLTDHTSNADYCSCPEGEYFDYRTRKCSVIDLCPLMVCEKTEICSDNMCKCKDNYKRNNQSGICEPNYCEIKKCPSDDMLCEENLNGYPEEYSCFCREGYAFNGTSCNYVVCDLPVLNVCSQICQPEADGYLCACNEYFKLKEDNTTCEYTGNEECSNKTCGKGSCMKKDGEEICICAPGYIEQNGKCIDQCTADKLPVGICPYNKCEPIFEKEFRCVCEGKYALSNNGITCTKRNLCSQNEAGWKYCEERAAICEEEWNSFQGFKCICPKGFVKIEGVCKDLCDIKDNQRYCYFKGGICDVDENYHLSCRCPPSFVKDEITGSCNKIADYSYLVKLPLELNAYRKPSRKTGRIDKNIRTLRSVVPSEIDYHKIKTDIFESLGRLYENFQHANILSCTGLQDFSTCIVELQFKEYTWEKLYRLKIGSLCSFNTTLSNRDCLIPPSLVLRRDKIESEVVFNITDQCNEAVKPNLCSQYTKCYSNALHKYFSCTCKSGFNIKERKYPLSNSDSVIEICEDFNECESSVPCPVTTVCINTIGSYKCLCKPGYRLTNYTLDPKRDGCVELCNPNPCIKGECKSTGLHTFECRCQAGFAGALCDVQDKNYKDATMNTIIVGAVLGGVLLLTIVIFISTVSRLRKKKFGIENSQIIAESSEMAESRPVRTGVNNRGYQRD